MPIHTHAAHTIEVDAPVDQCFMYFTPAGEELWVDGWQPRYVHPADGRTEAGMVFTTGEGADHTVWMLADFDRGAHRSRYARVTPGSRTGFVEVQCRALDGGRTAATVAYTMTALSPEGEQVLEGFEGERFRAMINEWAGLLARHRGRLIEARIR